MVDDTTGSSANEDEDEEEERIAAEFLVEHRLTTSLKQAIATSDVDKVLEILQQMRELYIKEGNKAAAKICGKRIEQIKAKNKTQT